jgi:4-hydroxybenzoate polyprenyltransferase
MDQPLTSLRHQPANCFVTVAATLLKLIVESREILMKSSRAEPLQLYPSPGTRARSLLTMARLPGCAVMGFAVILGETIASPVITVEAAILGFMTGFLVLAVNMVLSGFVRQNTITSQPARTRGSIVKHSDTLSFALVLGSFGVLFAALSGPLTLAIALLALAMIVAAEALRSKFGLLRSGFAGASIGLLFVYAGFAVGAPTLPLVIFAVIAFVSVTGREIMKNSSLNHSIQDDTKSKPEVPGKVERSKASAVCFLVAAAFGILPPVLGLVSSYYLPLALIADVGFLLTAISMIIAPTQRMVERNQKYSLLWMGFGLLAFVIGVI